MGVCWWNEISMAEVCRCRESFVFYRMQVSGNAGSGVDSPDFGFGVVILITSLLNTD